jgi:hypothetical protein
MLGEWECELMGTARLHARLHKTCASRVACQSVKQRNAVRADISGRFDEGPIFEKALGLKSLSIPLPTPQINLPIGWQQRSTQNRVAPGKQAMRQATRLSCSARVSLDSARFESKCRFADPSAAGH